MDGMSTGTDPIELTKRTDVGTEYCPGYVIVECSEPRWDGGDGWWYVFWEALKA